jgi:hypothetical protein
VHWTPLIDPTPVAVIAIVFPSRVIVALVQVQGSHTRSHT